MAKQCIGLDIGSSAVKAVQLKRKGSGWALQAFGMQPLVPQTIVDGTHVIFFCLAHEYTLEFF